MSAWQTQTRATRVLVGTLGSVLGTALVVVSLTAMHMAEDRNSDDAAEKTVSFELPKLKKPEPKKQSKRKPPARRRQSRAPKRSGPPRVATALSGASFGLDDYAPDDADDLDASLLGNTDDVVMTEGTVDVAPRAVSRPPLTIPERLRRKGVGGAVVMSLLIDKSGRVEVVKILESNPAGVFDEVASSFVRQWAFEPATYRGKAVKTWARQTLTFKPQ